MTKTSEGKNMQIGRLAMRKEDHLWCAYYALPNTMDDAIFLGSITIRFVETEERRDRFMSLMRDAVADILQELTGKRPDWPNKPTVAPEHERRS